MLADDSMLGRDTPSPGLERAAKYVIAEFQRLGLRPAGDSGTYEQRYGLSRWTVDTAASSLEVSAKGAKAAVAFGGDVRVIGGEVSGKPISGHADPGGRSARPRGGARTRGCATGSCCWLPTSRGRCRSTSATGWTRSPPPPGP